MKLVDLDCVSRFHKNGIRGDFNSNSKCVQEFNSKDNLLYSWKL